MDRIVYCQLTTHQAILRENFDGWSDQRPLKLLVRLRSAEIQTQTAHCGLLEIKVGDAPFLTVGWVEMGNDIMEDTIRPRKSTNSCLGPIYEPQS